MWRNRSARTIAAEARKELERIKQARVMDQLQELAEAHNPEVMERLRQELQGLQRKKKKHPPERHAQLDLLDDHVATNKRKRW